MRTANIICPFDPVTRATIFPTDKDDQPVQLDWCHLTQEKGNSVVVQVRGEDAVIEAMINDPAYLFLEEIKQEVSLGG